MTRKNVQQSVECLGDLLLKHYSPFGMCCAELVHTIQLRQQHCVYRWRSQRAPSAASSGLYIQNSNNINECPNEELQMKSS